MSAARSGGPFPNYVSAERAAAGLSQADLAKASGIDRPWLSRIESGQTLASPKQLDALCEALGGISAGRLYDRDWLEVIGRARSEEQVEHAGSEAGEQASATTGEAAA